MLIEFLKNKSIVKEGRGMYFHGKKCDMYKMTTQHTVSKKIEC